MFSWFKKPSPPSPGPDWSHVDTRAKADLLVSTGELARLQLLPQAFGGDDRPENHVHVPPFVVEIKAGVDEDTVMSLVEKGMVQRYIASPRYQGKSVVPIAIDIEAKDPADFRAEIKIWGSALIESKPSST